MKYCISACLFNACKYIKNEIYLNIPKTIHHLNKFGHFDVVIYHDTSLTSEMKNELEKYSFVKLILKDVSYKRSGCFWRYEAYNDYDIVLYRDIDIGLQTQDALIFNNFINSDFDIFWTFLVHQRKPYPQQGFVMGGVFGMKKNNKIKDINILIQNWKNEFDTGYYGSDEEFLSKIIYNLIKPIVYYEPRIKNVKLNNDYETYIMLPENYDEHKWN